MPDDRPDAWKEAAKRELNGVRRRMSRSGDRRDQRQADAYADGREPRLMERRGNT